MRQILFGFPAFTVGSRFFPGFYIYTYGVVLSFAFLISLVVAVQRAKAQGLAPEKILDLCVLLLIAGVVGSRLLFVLEEWPDYAANPAGILNIREGGLSIHGGLILGLLVGWWYLRAKKLPFWSTADLLAPAIAVGMGIGRIGCFFNGCCLGIPTKLPWAVVFKDNPQFFGPRHPTQLYEMFLDFAIAGVLIVGFRKSRPGTAFVWLGILSGTSRFFIEFLRADTVPAGPLSVAQWICLAILGISGAFLVRLHRQVAERGHILRDTSF